MTFSVKLKIVIVVGLLLKSMNRYSAFTDQFGDMANSMPPPAVQPIGFVTALLQHVANFKFWKAAPPVP